MKQAIFITAVLLLGIFSFGCSEDSGGADVLGVTEENGVVEDGELGGEVEVVGDKEVEVTDSRFDDEEIGNDDDQNNLIIIGEGGPSGNMFRKAAETYKKENGGDIYEVHNGDEFVAAMRNFVAEKDEIDHLEFFGHGNHIGLYVNQTPNVNGGLYANDPDLNKDYSAASIYELSDDIFSKYGWIQFNGCNVANGYPETNSLAQSFANYFNVDVVAPLGPTEFSSSPFGVDPIENSNYLDPNFSGDVYMVTTYADKNFVVVAPQEEGEYFNDVRVGQSYEEAVYGLMKRGLNIEITDGNFKPYKNITYFEAQEFCRAAMGDVSKCSMREEDGPWWIRNLKALKMLTDAYEIQLKYTNPWYESYVWWANNEELLTKDFTTKKWYTRGEMAELTWNFVQALD